MNKTKCLAGKIGFVWCAALVGVFTGCVGYVDGPRHGEVHVRPPSVRVDAAVVVHDDYVYYPSYQVYYSSNRRQYVYLEGSAWVTRPSPPRVSVDVLFASPSVRLDFRDAPSMHHSRIVREYPKHWTPPGQGRGSNDRDGRRDDDKNQGKEKGKEKGKGNKSGK